MRIFTIGHISPDLDAVVSAVAYAKYLESIKRYEGAQIIPTIASSINSETKFIFEKFGVEIPKMLEEYSISNDDKFILVDHNEGSQRHSLINNDQIIEIVDHHKININFLNPVKIDVKPLGSTSSIICELFKVEDIFPPQKILGLILGAILSDTVGLKSSTTTKIDKLLVKQIAESLDIDVKELTKEIFECKANISGLTAKEIVEKDFKIYHFANFKVFIGTIEVVSPEKLISSKMLNELQNALKIVKEEKNIDYAYLGIQDIININTKMIFSSSEEKILLERAFSKIGAENFVDIGKIISRKKEIAPLIEKTLLNQS